MTWALVRRRSIRWDRGIIFADTIIGIHDDVEAPVESLKGGRSIYISAVEDDVDGNAFLAGVAPNATLAAAKLR